MATFLDIIFTPLGILIRAMQLILVLAQIYVGLFAVGKKTASSSLFNNGAWRYLDFIHFLGGVFFLIILLEGTSGYTASDFTINDWPWMVDIIYGAPWFCVFGIEMVSLFVLYARFRNIRAVKKEVILRTSVKKMIDSLPAGICFYENRKVVLSNIGMNKYAMQMTGKALIDGGQFWDLITRIGRKEKDRYYVRNKDGRVISFKKKTVNKESGNYEEITAFDFTELVRVTDELEANNKKLRDVQYRMKAYQVRAADMFMDQELLSARIAVHDGLGSLLLRCKAYLNETAEDKAVDEASRLEEEKELLQLLKYTNGYLLSETEEKEIERDYFREGLRMAEGIGVKVVVEGEIPEKTKVRKLIGRAIGECAANTVKHAGGDELRLNIYSDAALFLHIDLTNNGSAPKEPVKETGGLLSLRRTVEKDGGEMEIGTEPEFTVSIILPEEYL